MTGLLVGVGVSLSAASQASAATLAISISGGWERGATKIDVLTGAAESFADETWEIVSSCKSKEAEMRVELVTGLAGYGAKKTVAIVTGPLARWADKQICVTNPEELTVIQQRLLKVGD